MKVNHPIGQARYGVNELSTVLRALRLRSRHPAALRMFSIAISPISASAWAGQAQAGTFFGALGNFGTVNDAGSNCNGFEIDWTTSTLRR